MYRKAKKAVAKLLSLLCMVSMAQVSFCEPTVDGWGRLGKQLGEIAARAGKDFTKFIAQTTRAATEAAAKVAAEASKQSPVIHVNFKGNSLYRVFPKITGQASKTAGAAGLSGRETWAAVHGQGKEIPEYEDAAALREDFAKYVQARYDYPDRVVYLRAREYVNQAPSGAGIYKVWEFPAGIAHIRTELVPWEIPLRDYVFVQPADGTGPITLIQRQVEDFLANPYRKPLPEALKNLQSIPDNPTELWGLIGKWFYYSYDELQGDMFLFFDNAPEDMKQSLLIGKAMLKDENRGWLPYNVYNMPVDEIQIELNGSVPQTYNAPDYVVFIRDDAQSNMQDLDMDERWTPQTIIINKPEYVLKYTVGEIEWL